MYAYTYVCIYICRGNHLVGSSTRVRLAGERLRQFLRRRFSRRLASLRRRPRRLHRHSHLRRRIAELVLSRCCRLLS